LVHTFPDYSCVVAQRLLATLNRSRLLWLDLGDYSAGRCAGLVAWRDSYRYGALTLVDLALAAPGCRLILRFLGRATPLSWNAVSQDRSLEKKIANPHSPSRTSGAVPGLNFHREA